MARLLEFTVIVAGNLRPFSAGSPQFFRPPPTAGSPLLSIERRVGNQRLGLQLGQRVIGAHQSCASPPADDAGRIAERIDRAWIWCSVRRASARWLGLHRLFFGARTVLMGAHIVLSISRIHCLGPLRDAGTPAPNAGWPARETRMDLIGLPNAPADHARGCRTVAVENASTNSLLSWACTPPSLPVQAFTGPIDRPQAWQRVT